ncbi:MAG: protein translocase subunit SecF [Gammaproteobacteria bacterium]|nr:protein translocase subunit SecF [Gammaproteobacteria bacterium]
MRLIKTKTNIDFLSRKRRNLAVSISILIVVLSIASLATRGLNLGIDFTGGFLFQVQYPQAADLVQIRQNLADAGFGNHVVQEFGTEGEVLVRLPPLPGQEANAIRDSVFAILAGGDPDVNLLLFANVSAQVGEELTEQGGLAMIFSLLMIFAYVMFRFQWKFAMGAVAALAHDVIVTVGFFSVTGISFDLTVVAAVLAVIGYSLNDTVVAFDRIRENFTKLRGATPEESMNTSINEMLARTIITGVTTLIVLTALLVLGGESVGPFSIALIVGIIVGTYSSIYTASAAALMLHVTPQDLLPPEVDPELIDDLP